MNVVHVQLPDAREAVDRRVAAARLVAEAGFIVGAAASLHRGSALGGAP
jgi:hypothetical protein